MWEVWVKKDGKTYLVYLKRWMWWLLGVFVVGTSIICLINKDLIFEWFL